MSQPLPVDTSAPQVKVDGLPESGWSRNPLTVTISASDDLSGVASITWSLNGSPTQTSSGPVTVPISDGKDQILTTTATDNAGNPSTFNSTVINVDSTPPIAWLARAGGRPNDFAAFVQDPVSGLDSAALEFRRVDANATESERVWRQGGAAFLPASLSREVQTFTRALDDSALPDGSYELRVVGTDIAGNVGFGSTLPAGGTVVVELPLRSRPAVTLAVADRVRRCSSKRKGGCATSTRCRKDARCSIRWVTTKKGAGIDRIVDWADRSALIGTVLTTGGAPLRGVKVSIFSSSVISGRELVHTTTTASDGTFEWLVPSGTTRNFYATTGATSELASAETSATLAVRAGVTFNVSDLTPRPGATVRLSGRLMSGGIGVPAGGKKIVIEFYSHGEWHPTRNALADGVGRFERNWFVPRSASGTVRLRARAESQDTETAWPFEDGKSKPVRLEIHR